jgi:hypothetical protein
MGERKMGGKRKIEFSGLCHIPFPHFPFFRHELLKMAEYLFQVNIDRISC